MISDSSVLNRCGRKASRSPGMSPQRLSTPSARASSKAARPAPLVFCELDWRPSPPPRRISTWADTSSLRLREAPRHGHAEAEAPAAGAGVGAPPQ